MRVELKIYLINNLDENFLVLVIVDFVLIYFIVVGDIERLKVLVWLVILDVGGYLVFIFWVVGKFGGNLIFVFIKESKVEEVINCKDFIILGKVVVFKGDIEDNLLGWNVVIGLEEFMELFKFLKGY